MKNIENLEELRTRAFEHCNQFVTDRLKRIQLQIKELEEALTTETKSSAGDKHETGRAMIQLEREKLGRQLAELERTQQVLTKVPQNPNTETIGIGNLVVSDTFIYYIAISAGQCEAQGQSVFCISGATPIGQLLNGKAVGEKIDFKGKTTSILAVH